VTRLADVARPAGPAIFLPIVRPRISLRFDDAAAGRIILVVAPAGYGKSLALSHWLDWQPQRYVRFDVQAEHSTLLGFARGIAEAFTQFPALRKTVATAYQNSASAAAPGQEMARWMAAHLDEFDGVIAVDDFHRAGEDIEVSRFLASLIARTKSRTQWVLATRSTLDLPVASWLAYGEAHFIIGDRDLIFHDEEALQLSEGAGQTLTTQTLRGVMDATSGWPVALGLALRNSTALNGGANLSHATREVLFQYLAEQVYGELSAEERDLLHFAAYLPSVDVSTLEIAGHYTSARVLEAVRRRATFLSLESPGRYKCHDLFREFLRRQIEIAEPAEAKRLQEKAADTLERAGDVVAALRVHAQLHATDAVLRLLRAHGFDLMDRSRGDVVESALRVVPPDVRSSDAIILGLRAQRAADAGHLERAEALFKSALRVVKEPDIKATLSLRLAIMLVNSGRSAADLLEAGMTDSSTSLKAEIFGLLSVDYSSQDSVDKARWAMLEAEKLCHTLDDQAIIAKVNLRTSVAGINIGSPAAQVRRTALIALEMASRSGLLMLAGRASTALATISLCLESDLEEHVQHAEAARRQAAQSGDRENLETALLQLACAETQLGDDSRLDRFVAELDEAARNPWHEGTMECLRASAFIWKDDFENAERLMSSFGARGYSQYAFDQVADMALHAMCCIAIGNSVKGMSIAREALARLKTIRIPHLYAKSQCEVAAVTCEIVQTLAHKLIGRNSSRHINVEVDTQPAITLKKVLICLSELGEADNWQEALSPALRELEAHKLRGLSRTIRACVKACKRAASWPEKKVSALTPAEFEVIRLVGLGVSTKEIAAQRKRSVHTIRTLIQRAITKLGCPSRVEAVRTLRHRGEIS
jgi:ATP/maltotriose-dependent transcriptional regulator MalT